MKGPAQAELIDAHGKFRGILEVARKPADGLCRQVKHAILIHNQAVRAVQNFHELYVDCQDTKEEHRQQFDGEEDLLRGMLLFACSGLDAVIKQLVEDGLPTVLEDDAGAQHEFQKFVERKLKKGGIQDYPDRIVSGIDVRLISELLVSFDPRTELIFALCRSLAADSLQSRDQILKVAAHFALTREEIMDFPDVTKDAFDARNQIVHEMDIHLESDNRRRVRDYETIASWCANIIAMSGKFIDAVGAKVSPVVADEVSQLAEQSGAAPAGEN